jgi:hypothetical protein
LPTRKRAIVPDWLNQQGPDSSITTWQEFWYGAVSAKTTVRNRFIPASVGGVGYPGSQQVTVDESHTERDYRRLWDSSRPGDTGGPFFSQKIYKGLVNPSRVGFTLKSGFGNPVNYNVYQYEGIALAREPYGIPQPSMSLRNLTPLGSTAIARCKPTNSVAQLATFLAELYRDGLPKLFGATLWKEHTSLARSAGEEYLNEEFGWKPLVSDVRDITHALTHANAVLEQFERGSGHVTRRRYEFPVEQTRSVTWLNGNAYAVLPNGLDISAVRSFLTGGELYKETQTFRRAWFSGAFTYHLPTGYKARNALLSTAVKAQTLTGLDLTPEVLWNAAPWSWAVDWFSNAGDVISNLSDWSTDGLVLKYGYIMEHCFIKDTYFITNDRNTLPFNKVKVAGITPIFSCVETKRREQATPFGFGLTWSGLSPRQIAIATALGLTRRW